MPANRFASSYLNDRYARLLAAVQDMTPPAFSLSPTSEQFQSAADHLNEPWVSALDDYLLAIAREAAENARSAQITTADRQSILSTALADNGLALELELEAREIGDYDPSADYADHLHDMRAAE